MPNKQTKTRIDQALAQLQPMLLKAKSDKTIKPIIKDLAVLGMAIQLVNIKLLTTPSGTKLIPQLNADLELHANLSRIAQELLRIVNRYKDKPKL